MHAVLRVQEILSNVFGHCYSPLTSLPCGADLAALARTCRTFKEPALDILWSELRDLSPLPRCLPEICSRHKNDPRKAVYGFNRPLQEREWHILRSYSRRIWRIRMFDQGLYWGSVGPIVNPPTSEPLFPNVRYLCCLYLDEIAPLLRLPFPSLTTLGVKVFPWNDFKLFQGTLESFTKLSPNISNLDISVPRPVSMTLSSINSDCVCYWSNLCAVNCSAIAIGVDTLLYLSRMPTLTSLSFTLGTTLLDKVSSLDPPLIFPGLDSFIAHSELLISTTRLLSRIHLPAVTSFGVYIHTCPSKENIAAFFASLQTYTVISAIERLQLFQVYTCDGIRFDLGPHGPNPSILCFDDLCPLMAFANLEDIYLDLAWDVGLVDSDLLSLGQAWHNLGQFSINREWGWVTPRITPQGLAELVQTCPSLTMIDLAMDTRSFAELPSNLSPNLTTLPYSFSINVIDSTINEESISAMAAFFARIVRYVDVVFEGWEAEIMAHPDFNDQPYERRWKEVFVLAEKIIRKEYSNLVKTSGATRIYPYFPEDDDV